MIGCKLVASLPVFRWCWYFLVPDNASRVPESPWPVSPSQNSPGSWTGFESNSKDMSAQNLLQELAHLHDSKCPVSPGLTDTCSGQLLDPLTIRIFPDWIHSSDGHVSTLCTFYKIETIINSM